MTSSAPEHVTRTRLGEPVTFLEAIAEALWEELERDPDVFLMGEDIGTYAAAGIRSDHECLQGDPGLPGGLW